MRLALIVSPIAGRGQGLVAAAKAQAVLEGAGWDAEVQTTQGPGDATRLARQAVAEGHSAVLACGSDGTLPQVLAGLVDSGVPAGVIPAGTGNDLCRSIGLSHDPTEAARQLLTAREAPVDLLEVNAGDLWSVNIVGLGLDAKVALALRINRRRRLTSGLLAYLSAVAQELAVYRPVRVRLEVDGADWEDQTLLVAIANARSYGAGMMIAPMAQFDDGLLDVVAVTHVGRLEVLRSFPRVLRGTHLAHPAVHTWRGRGVEVSTLGPPAPALVDGDVECETPLCVRIAPSRVRLLLSAGAQPGQGLECAGQADAKP